MHMNNSKKVDRISVPIFMLLHVSLLFSSLSGICSKMAAFQKFLSLPFLWWYITVLIIMFAYAIVWQQILKRISLSIAYANKSVGLIWGMLWGGLIFQQKITWNMILGAGVVFMGLCLVVTFVE